MYGFKAIVFDGKRTAQKALDTLEDYTPMYIWVDDVAVVTRSKHGGVRVHSTWAQNEDARSGVGWGAITGGLLGLILGPAGAMIGATIGGSLGGLIGEESDIAFDDPRLDDFAAALVNDTSALILVGETDTIDGFNTAIGSLGGKIITTDLDASDVKAIRKALRQAD
ncbi:MAG: DUF1269 domain-containing protein [Paracoccaceae bacterium]